MIFQYLHRIKDMDINVVTLTKICNPKLSPDELCEAVQQLGLFDNISKFRDAVELMGSLKKLEDNNTFDQFSYLQVTETAIPPREDNIAEKQAKIIEIIEKDGRISKLSEYEYDCILYQRSMVDLLKDNLPDIAQRLPHMMKKIPLPKLYYRDKIKRRRNISNFSNDDDRTTNVRISTTTDISNVGANKDPIIGFGNTERSSTTGFASTSSTITRRSLTLEDPLDANTTIIGFGNTKSNIASTSSTTTRRSLALEDPFVQTEVKNITESSSTSLNIAIQGLLTLIC
jgi:hypothetical protein